MGLETRMRREEEPEEGEGIAMALVEQAFPWAGILAPLVLAEDAGGDFVALVRAGPIAGHVVVFRHDDAPDVLARSLADWLDGSDPESPSWTGVPSPQHLLGRRRGGPSASPVPHRPAAAPSRARAGYP